MGKPGVILYFDVRPCLKRLSDEEKGRLFEAILEYGENGVDPNFEGMLGIAWDFIQPSIDRDSNRYDHQVSQKRYAAYVREAKKKGVGIITFEEWHSMGNITRHHPISADIERYPTTTPATTSTTTPATTSTRSNMAGKPPKPVRHKYGEYQNVLLTDEEYEKLKSEIPEYKDMIERLSSYIASSGKKYKNHLATMRNWYRKENPNGQTEPKPIWTVGTTA